MNNASSLSGGLLSTAALRRVDEVCTRFENLWRSGQRPRLEAFLSGTHGPEREELLRELLRLERHYRQSLGEPLDSREYEGRFPEDIALIRAVLAEGGTVAPAADSNATGPEAATPEAHAEGNRLEPRYPSVPGYEIIAELGRGGMGIVYEARHTSLKRLVALKMILSGNFASPEQLDRFQREAEALARLQHPNIIRIYEVGEVQGSPFFSLEFVEGGSLERHLGGTPQPPRSAAELVATLARAMHAAHQSGVVHRDLKPANILLGRKVPASRIVPGKSSEATLETFEPKISDFGLAKSLDGESNHTHTGVVLGTPSYMSPEQAEGRVKDVGPAVDVYALAAILYELLTGRPPFKGATFRDTIELVCTREPIAPSQLQPKVPGDLETVCLKGLRKDARQRYTTAQELADDLQRWLDGRPIVARPVSRWERAWKWARRRPALAGLAAAVLVACLAGTASAVLYGLYESQNARAREHEAQASRDVQDLYVRGQQAEADGRFDQAQEHYVQALGTLNTEPGAAGEHTRPALEDKINSMSERLKEQGRLAGRQVWAERRQRFREHYHEVRFCAVRFRDQEAADDAAAVRKEAPVALKELGLDTSTAQLLEQGLESLRQRLETPEQRQQLAEECVEVLLAWADAEAVIPAPGGPSQALRLLDGAAAVGRAFGLGSSRALHRRRAKCLDLLNDDAGARAENKNADGITPTTALDHFDAALTSYRASLTSYRDQDVTEASVACAKVLRLRSDHFWAQYLQAVCYLRQKRWGEAEVGLIVCLGQRPKFAWLFPLLGVARAELKRYADAESDFDQALAASSDPVLRALALTNRSVLRQRQGRPDDAECDLRESIELQPKVYQSFQMLTDLLKRRNDRAGALKLLDRALALNPENPDLYFDRARLHAENGDRKSAWRDFEQVIAKERPGSKSDQLLKARVELARLRCLAGDHQAALADCEAVLAANANIPEAHRQRAEVLLAIGGRHKEAGLALEQYLKVGGKETAAVHKARGLLYQEQQDYRAAVAAYSQALVLEPDAKTLSYRGWAFLKQEAVRPALDDFDAALKRNPQDADALTGRGTALVLRGQATDVAKATAAAEKALRAEQQTIKRLVVCVHIYRRAAELQKARNPRLVDDPQATRYAQRALRLLRDAEESLPEKERETFWRDHVRSDPGLLQLMRTYGRERW
jgi:tetratricopeptide (TPR) repeat protein